jgi:hypothetical protein
LISKDFYLKKLDGVEVKEKYQVEISNIYAALESISKNLQIKIYKTVISTVVLYGCETFSLTLREEHRMRVSENGVEEDIWT